MPSDLSNPLILTLAFRSEDQMRFDRLREAHFPPERNLIPAHLTLFHALPGAELEAIGHLLNLVSKDQLPMALQVIGLRSLGRGVAYTLASPALAVLRAVIARAWHGSLSAQDRQGFRPHITIQNKVSATQASTLLAKMQAAFVPFEVLAEGLQLWRYQGGPWERLGSYRFRRGDPCQPSLVPPDGRA